MFSLWTGGCDLEFHVCPQRGLVVWVELPARGRVHLVRRLQEPAPSPTSVPTYRSRSHDLSVVQYISDWVAVINLGRVVDDGPAAETFTMPAYPATEFLVNAVSVRDPRRHAPTVPLPGAVSSATDLPTGWPFQTRCPRRLATIWQTQAPLWRDTVSGRRIRCHIPAEDLRAAQGARPGVA